MQAPAEAEIQWVHPTIGFTDEAIQGINVRSVPPEKTYKIVKDGNSHYAQGVRLQTDKINLVNRRINSVESKDEETQSTSLNDFAGAVPVVPDDDDLLEFVRTVVPKVMLELERAQRSALAFDSYEPLWDDKDDQCKEIRKLWKNAPMKVPEWYKGSDDIHRGQVMDVAWNATGTALACAYGRLDTYGWCDVLAPVCVWRNVFDSKLAGGAADLALEVEGFVHSLAFHPKEPAVLAGGTYNGEWKGKLRHGKGTQVWPDGAKYDGQWVDDKQMGEGKEQWNDGSSYAGQYMDGCKHGHGKYVWKDGSNFEGQFLDNQMNGGGLYSWTDGSTFEGRWSNQQMSGYGITKSPDGRNCYRSLLWGYE